MSLLMDSLNFEDRSEKMKQQLPELLEEIIGSKNWQPILKNAFASNSFQIFCGDNDQRVMTYLWEKEPTLQEWNSFCLDFKELLRSGLSSQEMIIFMPKGSRQLNREEAFCHMLEGREINYVNYTWDIKKQKMTLVTVEEQSAIARNERSILPVPGTPVPGTDLSRSKRGEFEHGRDEAYPFYRVSQLTREELSDILDISFDLNYS